MAGRPRCRLTVTAAERATLVQWTQGRNTPQALALRARIVLACEKYPTISEAARSLGLSRDAVGLWRSRFLECRLDGLHDQVRTGRPKADGADLVVQTLLTRPLSATAWSTRSLAAATGLSQSSVSRICRSLWPRPTAPIPAAAEPFRHLAGVHLDPVVRVLALCPGSDSPAPARTDEVPSRAAIVRNSVQTMFAATTTIASGQTGATSGLSRFLTALDRAVPAGHAIVLIIGSSDAGLATERLLRRRSRCRIVRAAAESDWRAYVEQALDSPTLALDDIAGLRSELHAWAHRKDQQFTWITEWGWINGSHAQKVRGGDEPHAGSGQRLADQVAQALREAIVGGQFQPGERIKEAPLADRLGISRGPIRDALRVLAEDGLLELLPNRGAAIPQMQATDVLETYAARTALGGLLVRRLATREPAALIPLATALANVRATARGGSLDEAAEADLAFQDAMADAAGLPRTALHFNRLAMQLRMFISILGLDYAYSPDRIVRDNTAIFEALRNRSPEDAALLWRAKLEHAVRYMVAQLPEEDFDLELWLTISAPAAPASRRT
ncbi:GntR family transcriptional regulator [Saccharopolyspora sp. WRP15-2]|uniref:GntR family transcriptional regulator n=1 Tax=Saccharopolyspora oryzae TaxID=2997343 RepID=A0ABT4UVG4_9PSEU|nr:GntR family transcriptional regulator [Saccharopolyspora oryzae]MDA3625201.1 GntR family transcriptional regulator [Saccharopolyspora oryzae]